MFTLSAARQSLEIMMRAQPLESRLFQTETFSCFLHNTVKVSSGICI